jgi:rhodanese-related sulfurtransferase
MTARRGTEKADCMTDKPASLEIDCPTVKTRLDACDGLVLLDCRERDEYDVVRIAGSRLMPMSEITQRVSELDGEQSSEMVVMCHHGVRSRHVAAWLRQQGFANVRSMAGGIDRWSLEIDPSLPRY